MVFIVIRFLQSLLCVLVETIPVSNLTLEVEQFVVLSSRSLFSFKQSSAPEFVTLLVASFMSPRNPPMVPRAVVLKMLLALLLQQLSLPSPPRNLTILVLPELHPEMVQMVPRRVQYTPHVVKFLSSLLRSMVNETKKTQKP